MRPGKVEEQETEIQMERRPKTKVEKDIEQSFTEK
jgi:hypothetical protein